MKFLVDIHVVLSTPEDMLDYHSDPEEASDRLNTLLHLVYDKIDEDMPVASIEKCLHYCWENWVNEPQIVEIDDEDLHDWVDHLLTTWDDSLIDDL